MKFLTQGILVAVLVLIFTSCQNKGKLLSREQYGEQWPLMVAECYVKCVGDYAIVISVDDHTYAVNKAAVNMNQFEDITPILKDNPDYPRGQAKMSLSEIEFEGLKLCERGE